MHGSVAAQPREEWLSASGSPVDAAGASPSSNRAGCENQQVCHLETKILNLIEPANIHLVGMSVCLEPRNCLVICP